MTRKRMDTFNTRARAPRSWSLVVVLALGLLAPDAQPAAAADADSPRAVSVIDPLRQHLTTPSFLFSPSKDGAMRRDPFRIPLTKVEVVKDGSGRPVDSQRYEELVKAETERLKALSDGLAALKEAVSADRREEVLTRYQQLDGEMKRSFALKVNEAEADRLRGQFEVLKPRISTILRAAALQSARAKLKEIEAAFEAAQYPQVVRLAEEYGKLPPVSAGDQSPEWQTLDGEVAAYARRARARVEFRQRSLRVTNLIVTSDTGWAVIDGVSCGAGSRLDADTLVAKVTGEMIVFVYKGERIEYRFGPH